MSDLIESPKGLIRKLAEVMNSVERIAKRGHNAHFGYDFATESDITAAVRSGMATRHLMMVPSVESMSWRAQEKICCVMVRFTIHDGESGETLSFLIPGEGQDSGDKAIPKSLTSATKYALLKLYLLPTGDDPEHDDGKRKPLRGKFDRHAAGYTLSPEIAARQAERDAEDDVLRTVSTPETIAASIELIPLPEPESERERLLKEIKLWADEAGLSPQDRDTAWKTYMGPNVTRKKADPAALADLLRWVKTRAKK